MTTGKRWCPQCVYGEQVFGQNTCTLLRWNPTPKPVEVYEWLKKWQADSTRIDPKADNCPGFIQHRGNP